jgi:hypothetical protein
MRTNDDPLARRALFVAFVPGALDMESALLPDGPLASHTDPE